MFFKLVIDLLKINEIKKETFRLKYVFKNKQELGSTVDLHYNDI